MEQFRAFLEVLKKYHFWVLSGLIVLLSLLSWYLATSDEAKRFAKRKSEIEAKLKLVGDVAGNREHPSTPYIQKIRDIESGPLTKEVENASNHLYNEQRDNNHAARIYNDDRQQEEFTKAFDEIWRPMEEIMKLPADALDALYRSRYQNHIDQHFPLLFNMIERRTAIDTENDSAAGGPGGRGVRPPTFGMGGGDTAGGLSKSTSGIVDWVDADAKINAFVDRFKRGVPSTQDIMLAQEDLWVYETLLRVIRNTNDMGGDLHHADKSYKAPLNHKVARIKQIIAMDIGNDAVQKWASCENALFTLPGEAAGAGGLAGRGGPPPQPIINIQLGRGGPTGQPSGPSALANRYVDDKGKPLADPTEQPCNREFRMIPINL